MDPKLEKYLIRLKGKMDDNESRFTSYIKSGAKLVKIGSGTSKREVNQTVTDYMDEYEVEEGDVFVIIYYMFHFGSYLHGPVIMTCEIKTINDKGKITRKESKASILHYLTEELQTRKWKSNDYKKLFNKSYTGKIGNGLKELYTARHLDR